ncbi:hypothetical protein GQ53DRAFT_67961 [Thozetella sp. PMI_491]|nr:hypothetical protein GQ53DRAFT_67961 [Thozetella sp. PMI_491]
MTFAKTMAPIGLSLSPSISKCEPSYNPICAYRRRDAPYCRNFNFDFFFRAKIGQERYTNGPAPHHSPPPFLRPRQHRVPSKKGAGFSPNPSSPVCRERITSSQIIRRARARQALRIPLSQFLANPSFCRSSTPFPRSSSRSPFPREATPSSWSCTSLAQSRVTGQPTQPRCCSPRTCLCRPLHEATRALA